MTEHLCGMTNQRQEGAGRPPTRHQVGFWSRTLKMLLIWAQILVSSGCKTPWLDSHPGPRFQYHGGQNTFVA